MIKCIGIKPLNEEYESKSSKLKNPANKKREYIACFYQFAMSFRLTYCVGTSFGVQFLHIHISPAIYRYANVHNRTETPQSGSIITSIYKHWFSSVSICFTVTRDLCLLSRSHQCILMVQVMTAFIATALKKSSTNTTDIVHYGEIIAYMYMQKLPLIQYIDVENPLCAQMTGHFCFSLRRILKLNGSNSIQEELDNI